MAVRKAAPPASSSRKTPTPPRGDRESGNGNGNGKGKGSMSKADVFDNAKATGQVDPGKYEAIIVEAVLQESDEKGQSVRFKYEIASEGDFRGESLVQFYKCFEANESAGKGLNFLKRDLAILGYDNVKFSEIEDVFEEIADKKIGVHITVKLNDQFTNVYLNGLADESEVIADYINSRAY